MPSQLFRTKSLDVLVSEAEAPQHQLKRTLGAFDVIMLGIGAIVGAGIFATIGTAAAGDATRPGAGPALILSFVLTAVACGFAALCYAEFAAMVPDLGQRLHLRLRDARRAGRVDHRLGPDHRVRRRQRRRRHQLGQLLQDVRRRGSASSSRTGCRPTTAPPRKSRALRERAASLRRADRLQHPRLRHRRRCITVVLVIGIRESASLNTGMVMLKLDRARRSSWSSAGATCIPTNWQPFAPNGWAGVQAGAAIVFFAYIGFDAVSTVAEECRNPERDLPIGIIGSLIICTIIYIVVAAVFTGIIPYNVLVTKLATEQAEPLTMALQYANIEAGAICSSASSRSDRSSRTRPCCSSFSSASRESSSRWPATACFRRASRRCIRGFERRTSRRF